MEIRGLDAINSKLKWTHHHFQILDQAVTAYTDPECTKFFVNRYNDAKTEAWGYFDGPPDPLVVISHIFGDVIQSANSCLDYLVCELFRRYNPSEAPKPSHKFPIVYSHGAFNKEIGADALYGIPFDVIAVIEGLQPYNGGADSVQSRLADLRTLTNNHKHRNIHVTTLTGSPTPSDAIPFERDGELYVRAEDLPSAAHFKKELGPFPVKDGKVRVEGKFAAVVVLEESGFRESIITLVAGRLSQAVSDACKRITAFLG